ncbi:hypothetical protein GmHk_06G017603 [Glycine max]|nr:hypothetical protein GmHk_06G017603 [Glycine max]
MDEKRRKKLEEATQSGSTEAVIDRPSPIRQHKKWKMTRTKKNGQMMFEAAKEIAEKIVRFIGGAGVIGFLCPPWTPGCPDCCHWRLEHLGRVRAVGAGVTIKQYFEPAQRTSCTSSSIAPEELKQSTQQIRDQLEESITEKVTRQLMLSLSQIQSQFQSQMQSQGLALPSEPEVGPSTTRVSTKRSYFDPSANDPDMGDSDKCGLYIEENPPRLVALGRVYEGSIIVHNIPLLHDQVKVGVEEVKDVDAPVPVPTDKELNTFLAWPTHLVKRLSEQVMWDATLFGLFNSDFPLYIKHEDLSEIAQVVNVAASMHLTETSMRLGNFDVYRFLESQSIQRSGQSQFESESYIKNWMQNSKRDVYLGAYLNGALKGLDDTPQPKSKVGARWIVVKYFNDVRPLESNTLKALRIQWANYYLKVRNET